MATARSPHTNHLTPKKAAIAFIAIAAFTIYVREAANEFRAARAATPGDHAALLDAIRYAPDNGDFRFKLGESYLFSQDFAPAITHLTKSVELNPNRAQAWMDLAHIYHYFGDTAKREDALKRAIAAAPFDQRIAWDAANIYLATGRLDAAMPQFKSIVQSGSESRLESLRLCWRATHDVSRVVRELGVADAGAFKDFFTAIDNDPIAAKTLYAELLASPVAASPSALNAYFESASRLDPASLPAAWESAEQVNSTLRSYRTTGNALGNGSFEQKLQFAYMDWRWKPSDAVAISTETADVKDGSQSVELHLSKAATGSLGLSQLVYLHAGEWQLGGFAKTERDDGTAARVTDASGAVLATADLSAGNGIWHPVAATFKIASDQIVTIDFVASRPLNAKGSIKLDGFTLQEVTH